jgi:hypothetical protein
VVRKVGVDFAVKRAAERDDRAGRVGQVGQVGQVKLDDTLFDVLERTGADDD